MVGRCSVAVTRSPVCFNPSTIQPISEFRSPACGIGDAQFGSCCVAHSDRRSSTLIPRLHHLTVSLLCAHFALLGLSHFALSRRGDQNQISSEAKLRPRMRVGQSVSQSVVTPHRWSISECGIIPGRRTDFRTRHMGESRVSAPRRPPVLLVEQRGELYLPAVLRPPSGWPASALPRSYRSKHHLDGGAVWRYL